MVAFFVVRLGTNIGGKLELVVQPVEQLLGRFPAIALAAEVNRRSRHGYTFFSIHRAACAETDP